MFSIGDRVRIVGTVLEDYITEIIDNRQCADPMLYERDLYYRLKKSGWCWSENRLIKIEEE